MNASFSTEAVETMNPVQEVPAVQQQPAGDVPPEPVVDPSAFLPSSRVMTVSGIE